MECSPKEINDSVTDFCKKINKDQTPQFVVCKPHKGCKENYCFENVDTVVAEEGGERITGWVIWQRDNIFLEAEAHSIMQTVEGKLIDITPHTPTEERILFVVDERVNYRGKRIPNKFYPLSKSYLVSEYIQLVQRNHAIEDEARDEKGFVVLSGDSLIEYKNNKYKIAKINRLFTSVVGRNELCPCGSGLKYKRCCGKYR